MLYIKVPDHNDSFSSITLDGTIYLLRFTWNGSEEYWNFGLYDASQNPILAGVKVVPNWPLNHAYHAEALPDGTFGAITDLEKIGRDDFKDGKASFVYIPNADIEEDDDE